MSCTIRTGYTFTWKLSLRIALLEFRDKSTALCQDKCNTLPKSFKIKPTDALISPNLSWLKNEPLHVSGSSSAHHQESINCALGTGIWHTVWKQLPSRAIPSLLEGCLQTVRHIPVPSVKLMDSWWRAEELPETCRGSFFSQNKLGKLVHLLVLL